jgi:hypothetical protein
MSNSLAVPDDSDTTARKSSTGGSGEDKVHIAKAKLAAEIFNSSHLKSIPRLVSEGILEKADASLIAAFFHSNDFLEKDKLGDFLGTK